MPNYEFYAQIYMQSREQQYTASYNAAYRDLMAEYKEEVRVQNLMAKMAVSDKKANAALRKALMNDPASFSEVTSFMNMNQKRRNDEAVAQAKAEKAVDSGYDYPPSLNELIWSLATDNGNNAAGFETQWNEQMAVNVSGLTKKQRKQLAVDMEPLINRKVYGGSGQAVIMTEYFYQEPTFSSAQLDKEKEYDRQVARNEAAMPPSALEQKQYAQAMASFPELEQYDLTGDADTGVQKKSMFEGAKVKPPTEPDILALAAEYYAPSAGKEFQASMEEVATERESSAQARKAEKAQLAKDLASQPEWAGRVYKVQGDTEAIIDVDDAELTSAPQKWARLHMDTGKYYDDLPGSIAAIDKQFPDDALAQSQALAMLMAVHVRRRRTQAEGDVDLVKKAAE